MAGQSQSLEFVVGMRDNASRKLAAVQAAISRTSKLAKSMGTQIVGGLAAVAGAGMSIAAMVSPAIEFNKALGEVGSLGLDDASLGLLSTAANDFAKTYGGSAVDVVRASYDIQSAIAGLDGAELTAFTVSSSVLAKATKSDASAMSSYMGTMYDIFQEQAALMGKADWAEQMAGQTALAVQLFKTSADEMGAAFSSLGTKASDVGVDQAEQMAILGTLQSKMGGDEAGSAYDAFLSSVGSAQNSLGLNFTDDAGNMLGIIPILDTLRAKFGDTIDDAESDVLKNAFGSDEAVSMITLLMKNTDGLSQNIRKLGDVHGMEEAEKQAAAMTDVWSRLSGSFDVASLALGKMLLPTIEALTEPVIRGINAVTQWSAENEKLSGFISGGIVYFLGATAAIGGVVAVMTVAKFLWMSTAGPLTSMISALKWLANITKIQTAMTWLYNAALYANPMVWVVVGIIALIAAVGALIYWWDDLVDAFMNMEWVQSIIDGFKALLSPMEFLGDAWDSLKSTFGFGDDEIEAPIAQTVAPNVPTPQAPGLTDVVGENRQVSTTSPVPDFMGESAQVPTTPQMADAMGESGQMGGAYVPDALQQSGRMDSVPRGGLKREISNSMSKNTSTNTNIETVNITAGDKNPENLWESMLMGVS